MKKKIIFLLLIFGLTSCQPKITPTPEIREVTRVVEQTVEIPQIVKETVMVTELVEAPPTVTVSDQEQFELKPEYFDAMLVAVQHFTYWETKQCEAYYDSFSNWGRPQNSKDDTINYCLSPDITIELKSVVPYNYNLAIEGKNPIDEPEDMVFFEVNYIETIQNDNIQGRQMHVWVSIVLEDGVWKVGKGGTSPPQYGVDYWNQ